jgi:membrane protein YqaA with SNARE-associated domain
VKGLLAGLGPWAVVVLGLAVAVYQPVGPDVFVLTAPAFGWSPLGMALLAILATAAGSCLGYGIGRGLWRRLLGPWLARRAGRLERAQAWVARRGAWVVALAAVSPIPLTQVCWAAGTLRMPWLRFLGGLFLGLVPRFLVEAALAAGWAPHLRRLIAGA